MTDPSPRDLALDPQWVPHAFEEEGQKLVSVRVPDASRHRLVFLTDGQFRGAFAKAAVPTNQVKDEAGALTQAPLNFIFHSSFCCSTLLARALEKPGRSTSLSEPNILVDVAERLIRGSIMSSEAQLDLALRLLARPFSSGESIVVKPSSFANRLIEPALKLRPQMRAVLLYSDAETFLSSVARRGLLGRINARKLYRNHVTWTRLRFGFSEVETFEQTDLQIAALAWLMQIAHFNELSHRFGRERLMILDAADLVASPVRELERVQSFFRLGFGQEEIRAIVEGPIFSKHSKDAARDYDSSARERDRESLMEVHSEELGMVLQWLNAVAAHLEIPLKPGVAA